MQWNVKDKGLIEIILLSGRGAPPPADKSISNQDLPHDPRFISFLCLSVFSVLGRTICFTGSAAVLHNQVHNPGWLLCLEATRPAQGDAGSLLQLLRRLWPLPTLLCNARFA